MSAPLPPRDLVILQMATEQGITDQGEIARRITAMGYDKIGAERVGQILRASSGRDRVVRFLEEHPDETLTSVEISTWLKLDVNKVNYVIDGLQKKGVVTYKVGRADNDHRSLVSISLTKRARARIAARTDEAIKRSPGVDHARLNGKVEDAGRADHERLRQAGIPVAVIPTSDIADIVQGAPAPEDTEAASDTPATQVVAVADEVVADEPALELPVAEAPSEEEEELALPITDVVRFPLISKLMDRERDLAEAAKLLERHGYDDLELSVLSKMDEYTPLEREVVRYVRTVLETARR